MAAPQQGQSDHSTGILWMAAAIIIGLVAIWYVVGAYIARGYLLMKLYEVKFLSWFKPSYFESLESSINTALSHLDVLSFHDMTTLGGEVGEWMRYPYALILFVFAILIYWGNAAQVFKRVYNLFDLAKAEKVDWPQISPVIELNLIKEDINKGPWAMAMTPLQYCKRNQLLIEIHKPNMRKGRGIEVTLKRGDANILFALQLGKLWEGTAKLPSHIRALFAIFAARANADSKAAAKLITQLNATSQTQFDFTGVDEILKKYENTKEVQEVLNSHAYVSTVMASLLEAARLDGVQATADFLWLKPLDRRLWYTLNSVGRQTPFVEVAGIFAHWVAEKEVGQKLLMPMIEEATIALENALKEVIYQPDSDSG